MTEPEWDTTPDWVVDVIEELLLADTVADQDFIARWRQRPSDYSSSS